MYKYYFIILLIFIIILSNYLIDYYTYYSNNYPVNRHPVLKNGKIFVSIASYRDPLLKETVEDLLNNCDEKHNIMVVICEQNDRIEDIDFELPYYKTNIVKILRLDKEDARGPCWARYLIQQEWSGEEYYLQIDSHTKFVKSWDTILKNMLNKLPEKSCLSNYVSTFDIKTGEINKRPLRGPMYKYKRDNDGFDRYTSDYCVNMVKPMISHGWSGCFSFSSSQIILDAPYDPNVPFLFFGEEMDIYERLKSRNWTMYVPNVPICFTSFDRSYRKTFWEHSACKRIRYYSVKRVKNRLGLKSWPYLTFKNDHLFTL